MTKYLTPNKVFIITVTGPADDWMVPATWEVNPDLAELDPTELYLREEYARKATAIHADVLADCAPL